MWNSWGKITKGICINDTTSNYYTPSSSISSAPLDNYHVMSATTLVDENKVSREAEDDEEDDGRRRKNTQIDE